ncbi:MAG: signal peptidase II [Candidatus Tokpelaia sp. JSC085]|nr:MAG: signal peptidase II [Candidatus Tokpelaia sp. JSC085]
MKYRSGFFTIILIIFFIILDQLVKFFVTWTMALGERIDLLPFLALYHTNNTGIAFSMLSTVSDVSLVVATVLSILFICWLLWRTEEYKKFARCGYTLVIGGAIGNLTDRLRLHYVTDYMLLHIEWWSFAIFNLADAFITIGAVLISFNELWGQKKRRQIN